MEGVLAVGQSVESGIAQRRSVAESTTAQPLQRTPHQSAADATPPSIGGSVVNAVGGWTLRCDECNGLHRSLTDSLFKRKDEGAARVEPKAPIPTADVTVRQYRLREQWAAGGVVDQI